MKNLYSQRTLIHIIFCFVLFPMLRLVSSPGKTVSPGGTIDLKGLAGGMYLLHLETTKGAGRFRIILQ